MFRTAVLALAACLIGAPAAAQTADDELFDPGDKVLGLFVIGQIGFVPAFSITGRGADAVIDPRGGWGTSVGLQVGYGLRPWLMPYISVDRSDHNAPDAIAQSAYSLHHIEVGARFFRHLASRPKLVPHADIAVGARQLFSGRAVSPITGDAGRFFLTGRALSLGTGVLYFVKESLALDGSAYVGYGSFTRVSLPNAARRDIDTDNTLTTRLRVGVAWILGPP